MSTLMSGQVSAHTCYVWYQFMYMLHLVSVHVHPVLVCSVPLPDLRLTKHCILDNAIRVIQVHQ